MEDIESGLKVLASEIRQRNIRSIAIPPLGSDLGGLNWTDVRSRITETLQDLEDVAVIVFEAGSGAPADGRPNRSNSWIWSQAPVEDATAFLDGRPKAKQRLERVTQLIEGFESPFGLLNCCPLSIGLSWNIRLPQRKK